ncbi:hypothetical protein A7L55_21430 [Acinetobacter baumannii]|nr:hypothetical protein A7L55_21430 [Acinetobacter baumannii]
MFLFSFLDFLICLGHQGLPSQSATMLLSLSYIFLSGLGNSLLVLSLWWTEVRGTWILRHWYAQVKKQVMYIWKEINREIIKIRTVSVVLFY